MKNYTIIIINILAFSFLIGQDVPPEILNKIQSEAEKMGISSDQLNDIGNTFDKKNSKDEINLKESRSIDEIAESDKSLNTDLQENIKLIDRKNDVDKLFDDINGEDESISKKKSIVANIDNKSRSSNRYFGYDIFKSSLIFSKNLKIFLLIQAI